MLLKIEQFYRRLNLIWGKIFAFVFLLMTLNVFYDVVSRYAFNKNSVAMQEMEWHLFAIGILFGVSVALIDEAHVRVDFIYDRFSVRTKATINIVGTIFFLLPLALLIFFGSLDFVTSSYNIKEISENPGGLPYRWIIKGMIPLAFAMLIFTSFGYVVQNINLYKNAGKKALGPQIKETLEEQP
jgi:TRAP-type mannitol/chloroaromatic compound transport system permease small subunit